MNQNVGQRCATSMVRIANILKQKGNIMSNRKVNNRKVYIVMCHNVTQDSVYISEVCSSKKKAEFHMSFISGVMRRSEPDIFRAYWVSSQRVV